MIQTGEKIVSKNRRASFDYHLGERFEAGLVLTGTEIKSIRNSKADLKRAYARPDNGEVWLIDLHISQYEQGNRENHEPERPRKLLLNRREIFKIEKALSDKGATLIPTVLYLKNGLAKVEIAIATGKKNYDKRQAVAEKDANRQIQRTLKDQNQ
ncbi:MAG: SsrA-binding protein [Cellvibrionaceae bacterium]|jgi:SsrA-binding protein